MAELLAAHLKDEGFGKFYYVSGWREDGSTSHAWLEKNSVILDVTADQFDDGDQRPLVATDLRWHSQFSKHRQCREDGDFREVGEPPHLSKAYAVLLQHLRNG